MVFDPHFLCQNLQFDLFYGDTQCEYRHFPQWKCKDFPFWTYKTRNFNVPSVSHNAHSLFAMHKWLKVATDRWSVKWLLEVGINDVVWPLISSHVGLFLLLSLLTLLWLLVINSTGIQCTGAGATRHGAQLWETAGELKGNYCECGGLGWPCASSSLFRRIFVRLFLNSGYFSE